MLVVAIIRLIGLGLVPRHMSTCSTSICNFRNPYRPVSLFYLVVPAASHSKILPKCTSNAT